MKDIFKREFLLLIILTGFLLGCQNPKEQDLSGIFVNDRLFIYQGDYNALGTFDEISQVAALYNYVVLTHGFYLDGSLWKNGKCLDVNYGMMPELLIKIRERNPYVKIFVYVPASADHPNGCWPQPPSQMFECPDGECLDFQSWTDLWLDLENEYKSIVIDGIFIDLVHPAIIGEAVRDKIFSYVKSHSKLIMANILSDTLGLKFAAASSFLNSDDFLLIEGYSQLAGYSNSQTEAINQLLQEVDIKWAALVTEDFNTVVTCNSNNMVKAYSMFKQFGGSAFAYQSADLGTQSGKWEHCDDPQN